jgi:ATP diphosphatase
MTAKAARVGFDWPDMASILCKLREEADELVAATQCGDRGHMAQEVGDLLFVAVNVARFLAIDPETALRRCNDKFSRRFRYIETKIKQQGKELRNCSLAEMDALWDEAKKLETSS